MSSMGSFPLSLSRLCSVVCVGIPKGTGVLFAESCRLSRRLVFVYDEANAQCCQILLNGGGLSHAHTLNYFFLVPKDDDDDETLFDLNTFFYMGHKRTERTVPRKLPIDFSRPFRTVPCPQTGTSGGRHRQLAICTSFGRDRAK